MLHHWLRAWAVTALLSWSATGQHASAQAVVSLTDPARESIQLAAGVIVAPRLNCIYVRALAGTAGIEALDARTLRVRARSSHALVPLLVTEGRLLAVASSRPFALVWLDAHSLQRTASPTKLDLPEWVAASATDESPGRFTWSADVADAVYVRYEASPLHVASADAQAKNPAEAARGVIRVDLETGETELTPRAPVPAAPANLRLLEPIRAGPFFVHGLSMVVSVLGGETKRVRVERRRLSDGVRLSPLTFALPAGGLVSLDRSALWLAEPVPEGGPVSAHVIATPSGSELGRVQLAAAPSAFITAGKQAWVVSELGLTALELGGARVHTRALLGQHREAPAPPSVASAAEAH